MPENAFALSSERRVRSAVFYPLLVAMLLLGGCKDDACATSTAWDAIRLHVLEERGCTNDVCHGLAAEGGLDLRGDAAYERLVHAPAESHAEFSRVQPGDEERSVLYWKLRAGIDKNRRVLDEHAITGGVMPSGNLAPITEGELAAISAWIRAGAPREGVPSGTEALLQCGARSTSPPPNKIVPLPAPASNKGVQLYSGAWPLPAQSENEVCFLTYYDFSAALAPSEIVPCNDPERFGEGRNCFATGRTELAQDGQSHHSIIDVYTPKSDPNDASVWSGGWHCLGGAMNGEACNPKSSGQCGARSSCATPVHSAVGCVGIDGVPSDLTGNPITGFAESRTPLGGSQDTTSVEDPGPGVYRLLPVDGFVMWNSHGFNLTEQSTTVEQWINLDLVPPGARTNLSRVIFDATHIFGMGPVVPFTSQRMCIAHVLPRYTRLTSLSSHFHKHGHQFDIWLPPNALATDECVVDSSCSSAMAQDRLACRFSKPDNCNPPVGRSPDYQSFKYADALNKRFKPELVFDDADPATRRLIACATYDNGEFNPERVKRESTKPNSAVCGGLIGSAVAHCGCNAKERSCIGGTNQGTLCNGNDAACGSGGVCDACPLVGGVTTDDEMLILLGQYYNPSRCVGGADAGKECNGFNEACGNRNCAIPAP